jgi:hypothetical protein
MAKTRTVEIRQINVSMHAPHSPQGYVDLFVHAFRLRRIFKRGRADGFLLGALYDAKGAVDRNELQGEIYRFTNIDQDAAWFNTQTGKPAEEAETEHIIIPGNLHPNLERILFVFRPREHRFWFISRDRKAAMGPSIAESFLQRLFDEVSQKRNLPTVEVTIVPDDAAVDEVLSIHRLTKLFFEFKRPNADDGAAAAQRIMERMKQRRVNRLREEMTSKDPDGIKTDPALKAEAKVAADNGYVASQGYDVTGKVQSESTKARPAVYPQVVDEAIETVWNVLERISGKGNAADR